MSSLFVDVIVLVAAGLIAGNAAGSMVKEYNLGAVKNTLVGALGGGAGYFLQGLIPPTVTVNGDPVLDNSPVNHFLTLTLVGAATGGVLVLVLGFMKAEASKSR